MSQEGRGLDDVLPTTSSVSLVFIVLCDAAFATTAHAAPQNHGQTMNGPGPAPLAFVVIARIVSWPRGFPGGSP
jgi:hypothetical protein